MPKPPAKLRWAPNIAIESVEVDGNRLRYIKTGKGPTLVLLHTLRTQLDLFEKLLPELAKHFTVYALDYPGHGYSDIPKARYEAAFFTDAAKASSPSSIFATHPRRSFDRRVDLPDRRRRRNPRVAGHRRQSLRIRQGPRHGAQFAARWFVNYVALVPFIGETVMRLRNFLIMKSVLNGGVADRTAFRRRSCGDVSCGDRRGHIGPSSACSAIRQAGRLQQGVRPHRHSGLAGLGRPGLGAALRAEHDRTLIPGVQMATLDRGGHFLALDRPQELIQAIVRFRARAHAA